MLKHLGEQLIGKAEKKEFSWLPKDKRAKIYVTHIPREKLTVSQVATDFESSIVL